ncbi:MAG TPA: hypothetical protein VE891_09785 [Allosphingosinicella sp.]|nr:hypothetical protein [Allosphingosinicella sp.]
MKTHPAPLARAAALLLAAAALPLAPAIAQDTADPAAEAPAPDATTSIPPPVATTPVQTTETVSPAPATEAEAAREAAPVRTTTRRTTTRTAVRRAPANVIAPVAPGPVAVIPVPIDTLPGPVTTAPLPPPIAQTPPLEVLPEIPPAPVTTTTVETRDSRDSFLPWLLGGLVLLGALAFFGLRRRRPTLVRDEQVYEPAPAPVVVPVASAPIVAPVERAVSAGRPELELAMRPRRAGVSGQDARVEFELTVGNTGPVAAENVRISTWMLAAGSSEAESALIVPRNHADTTPVTIGAGESRTMEASVALPIAQVDGDAVLPVVVADARYRLPDGSEGRTSASFAVGVPDGDGLAHFGIHNPSGLHEGVVARPLREPERV